MPPSDAFAADTQPGALTPLTLAFCPRCKLAQLTECPPPATLFGEGYVYLSSFSATVAEAARANAAALVARCKLASASRVVEIACNDGYLLRHFASRRIPVLGIEPAPIPAATARRQGIPVIETFFSESLAGDLVVDGNAADLVIANNVLAHAPDPNDFVAGISRLLREGGTAVVEVHSLSALIEKLQFDTIYHEHASYFSATSIGALFLRHGLTLVDLEHIPLQGGSLRLFFRRDGQPLPRVSDQIAAEATAGIADGTALDGFADRVGSAIERLRRAILALRVEGLSIAAYGAAAKGTMMLNHLGLDKRTVGYVVDRNPFKQGRRVPGVGIPIVGPDQLFASPPGAVLLLPWNLRDEILAILEPVRRRGTRVIVPLPDLEIL